MSVAPLPSEPRNGKPRRDEQRAAKATAARKPGDETVVVDDVHLRYRIVGKTRRGGAPGIGTAAALA